MIKKVFVALLLIVACKAIGADKMVVGYYPSWMLETLPPTMVRWQYLTHVAHAFIGPRADGQLDVPSGFLCPQLITAAHAESVKVVVSAGGWNTTYDDNFRVLAADSNARRAFANNLKNFCVANGYDGADIDWEYPGNAADRANHALMIRAIRQSFDSAVPRLTLSMVVPATNWNGQWFDLSAIKNDLDWIGIMTYDFYGNWSAVAGPNAPLYGSDPPNNQGWADLSVGYYHGTRGMPLEKLTIGVPFYGWTFNAAALYGTATGSPRAVQEIYSVIVSRVAQGWTCAWDAEGQVPYMQDAARTKLSSYDDSMSVALKAAYARTKGVAGVIIWALGQDLVDGQQVLLESVGKAIRPVTDIADNRTVPLTWALEQNYPNPFNPSTTIRYSLPQAAHVTLTVYNALGQQITGLVNGDQEAGSHSVQFNAAGLASGMYFCRFQVGQFSDTKKLIFAR